MKCKKCGADIPNGEIACPNCHIGVALLSQIKTEEDKKMILGEQEEAVKEQEQNIIPVEEVKVEDKKEDTAIHFDSDVLKTPETGTTAIAVEEVEEQEEETPMQPKHNLDETVDAEDVKKALEQYSSDTPKDIHFYLPIIIGMIAIIAIIIGIIYGIKNFL